MSSDEPGHIQVQHILIAFKGSLPGENIKRSKEEAAALAQDLLEQAQAGADFDQLVRKHTNDSPPGIYGMSNRGVTAGPNEHPRDQMVGAFGNVGFALAAGEYGLAEYDQRTSPYGWHLIKRLK